MPAKKSWRANDPEAVDEARIERNNSCDAKETNGKAAGTTMKKLPCVWEHNGNDTMLLSENLVGAFTRGVSKQEALSKMRQEAACYLRWQSMSVPDSFDIEIVQEKESDLDICDADSSVLFDAEKRPLSPDAYQKLKALALKSAQDFHALYGAVPDKGKSCLPVRRTFYGQVPRTAQEMYEHTKNVNEYYFGEIGVEADNVGTIMECRERGFSRLEQQSDYLNNPVISGSYGEEWSLRKVIRRFVWHDRIHAKAMYRMVIKTFGADAVPNIFLFDT